MNSNFGQKKAVNEVKKTFKISFPFAQILTVLFVALKVLQIGLVASWSWLWVLSPLWLPIVLVIGLIIGFFAIVALFFIGAFVFYWIRSLIQKRRLRKLRKKFK